MTRSISSALTILGAFAGVALAQNAAMPGPGPEHKKLAYFVGTWKSESEMKPMGSFPGGKSTSTERAEILPGGFYVVTHSSGTTPMGPLHELQVMGYDNREQAYTYDSFNNYGEHEVFRGAVEGDTWTWTGNVDFGGKAFKSRFVAKVVSPTVYTFRFDYSPDGTAWTNILEGKSTKME